MNGVRASVRRGTRELASSLCPLPCEDIARRGPSAKREEASHQNQTSGTLIRGFPASIHVRNRLMLLKLPVCGIFVRAP